MRWRGLILSALALLLLLPGCRREAHSISNPEGPTLEIAIQFPYVPATKAGELAATIEENKIHSLSIWVFRSEDHTRVGEPLILTDESKFPPSGGIGRYKFEVDWNFVNTHPDVDVFVLANAASIGCTLDADSNYVEVSAASFGYSDEEDYFGTYAYTTTVDPEKGLPMSGMKTHVKVYGSAPQMKVDPITLVRAVSRLRMVLCRTATDDTNEEDEVSVSGITFYKEQIAQREYVFTERSTGVWGYTPEDFSFSGTSDIKRNPVPEDLIYVNQDPDEYQQMLDSACEAGELTDLVGGYVYLRESDKRIFGRVDYKINGKDRSREFAMTAPGDFARNHTWTLLAYFMSGRNLQVSLVSSPWTKGDYHVDFSGQAVNVTRKFRMDERTCEVSRSEDGYIDVKLIPGTPAKGTLTITTPVGGTLMITPLGAASLFSVTQQATIAPETHGGEITIEITNNPDTDIDISELPASETTLTLSFSVSVLGREVNVDSEAIDSDYKYRFHL